MPAPLPASRIAHRASRSIPQQTAALDALAGSAADHLRARRIGPAYLRLLELERTLDELKFALTLEHGDAVVDALRSPAPIASEVIAAAAPAFIAEGFDCAVTAHPEGGYALLWRDGTRTGKYPFRDDAAKFARINGYSVKERR